ncbi:putative MATE family efflux protein [Arthrobacter ulcerisalmonis]|nr:putative MATE family efflux protein [Arthrobacter ulcerisalmonis]
MPQQPPPAAMTGTQGHAREILRLAVPAFGALVAEPLFLLADSAIVGHLGVAQLAGVGLASAVLQTVVGLMVFLAYSTTPAVARAIGDGQLGKALAAGRDGVWLALLLGLLLATAGFAAAGPLIDLMGADGSVRTFAVDYLRWSMPGLVAMLLIFAGTGVLRGLQDTRTPLVVATAGFGANIVLNLWLVYGLGMSVVGSAVGTSLAQWAMAAVYVVMVRRSAVRHGVSLLPSWRGIRSMTRVGSWLMLRTLSLRAAILATVLVVTAQGEVNLAAHQLAMTIFSFLAFALDALAIAAQALIGKELGASNAGQGPVADRDHDPLGRRVRRGDGPAAGRGSTLGRGAVHSGSPGSAGAHHCPLDPGGRATDRRVRVRPGRRTDRRGGRAVPRLGGAGEPRRLRAVAGMGCAVRCHRCHGARMALGGLRAGVHVGACPDPGPACAVGPLDGAGFGLTTGQSG